MWTILVTAGVLVIFGTLAARNWKATIGAGPTILIVGALLILGIWNVKLSIDRDADICHILEKRSAKTVSFDKTIIDIIDTEIPNRQDIVTRLTAALNTPLDC